MTAQVRRPVVAFDHNSAEHAADPVASYRAVREVAPIAWTEAWGGFWLLSGYDAVFDAARDDDTFSSKRSPYGGIGHEITIPKRAVLEHFPIELDPPESLKYRSIMNALLTPTRVRGMQPLIDRYTTLFIDNIIESGEADFASLTDIPAVITIDWLTMPFEDWRRHSWFHRKTMSSPVGSDDYKRAIEVEGPYLTQQMKDVIAERHRNPGDDPLSFILGHEIDGRPITEEEVLAMLELLISGGVGTTASLVGQTLVWLSQNTAVRDDLVEHPEKLQQAVEEFLRVFSPTQALARTVTHDTDFHGVHFQKGDRVLMSWASANRSGSDAGDNPDVVDIERNPNRHLAFGVGSHRCAGSHFGRAMSRTILAQILERIPDFEIDIANVVHYPSQGVNVGFEKVPAKFTPGTRRLEERF